VLIPADPIAGLRGRKGEQVWEKGKGREKRKGKEKGGRGRKGREVYR